MPSPHAGRNSLHATMIYERIKTVIELLRLDAYIPQHTQSNYAKLHVAVACGNRPWIYQLLQYPNNSNISTKSGMSALHLAAAYTDPQTVKILLNHLYNIINQTDEYGCTALFYALASGNTEIAKIFLKSGASINIYDAKGFTPLHIAVESENEVMVQEFIRLRGDINATNLDGRTPLSIACQLGLTNISSVLKYAGATVLAQHSLSEIQVPSDVHHDYVSQPMFVFFNPYKDIATQLTLTDKKTALISTSTTLTSF